MYAVYTIAHAHAVVNLFESFIVLSKLTKYYFKVFQNNLVVYFSNKNQANLIKFKRVLLYRKK